MTLKRLIQAIRKRSALGTEFAWVIAAQLFMVFGGLATIKLLSNVLSKQEFGIYALLFSIVSLLVSVLFTPLGQVNMRFLILAQQQGFAERFRLDIRRIQLLVSALALLLLVPAAGFLTPATDNVFQTYAALALLTLMMGAQSAQQYLLMAFRLRREGSVAQMIGAISRPLSVFFALLLFGYVALSAVYGLAAGFLILVLAQLFFLKAPWAALIHDEGAQKEKKEKKESSRKLPGNRDYFSYGSVYMLIGLVTVIVLNADRWILSFWGSLDQVAIYAALMQVALAPVAFAHAILTRLAAPVIFKARDKPDKVKSTQFRILLAFWAAMCLVILLTAWIFHYQLVQLLTNTSFATHSYLLPWMVLGLMLERSAQILELKGSMHLKTNIYIYPRLATIILVPALELFFLQLMGFDWLVVGLICATTLSLLSIVFVNRLKLHGL